MNIYHEAYIPALRRGVCVTRPPAPTPVCRGVPGTMTFEAEPLESLLARASSCRFFAVLHGDKQLETVEHH